MNVLVTGASGFIGRHLVEALARDFPKQKTSTLSLRPAGVLFPDAINTLTHALQPLAPDVVYHLAGCPPGNDLTLPPYFEACYLPSVALLQAIRRLNRPVRFFLPSSESVYGESPNGCHEEATLHPRSPFAFCKYLVEEYCRMESQKDGHLQVTVGRLASGLDVKTLAALLPRLLEYPQKASLEIYNLAPRSQGPLRFANTDKLAALLGRGADFAKMGV
jgi:nucleoside-diphosphate-sugar epimerase